MLASYLLDEDLGETDQPAHLSLQEGNEHGIEAPTLPSHKTEPYCNETLPHSKAIKEAPSEHVSTSFPPIAKFVPVNAPSFVNLWASRTILLPCKSDTIGATQALTNVSGIRSLVLAASESIVMPSLKKRKTTTALAAALEQQKRDTENKKVFSTIVAKHPVTKQAQSTSSSEQGERDSSVPQTTRSATVLGKLSEKTLNKLQAFKFVPHGNGGAHVIRTPHHRPDSLTVSGQNLAYLQQCATTAGDDYDFDDFDEFDLDENILEDILADDNAEDLTPDSTMLTTHDSSDVSSPTKPKSPQRALLEGSSSPYPAALFKSPLKLIEAPLRPLSPFLRSNLPQPVPTQAIIPSLVPYRRIPTLFRIAEVYRLLAIFSPTSLPQRIELYATVASSHRGYHTQAQEFTFADLFFPHRPPYLRGTYSDWHLCELFDEDSAPFLDATERNKLCRAIVQISKKCWNRNSRCRGSSSLNAPKSSQGVEYETDALEVDILNIWEAKWEDIEYVKGIVIA